MLMGTGLRRSELLALRWADVKLNAPLPFIQLRAGDTKSKRADVLPLRADLADVLRKAKGEADEGETVRLSAKVADLAVVSTICWGMNMAVDQGGSCLMHKSWRR
jgi:integrase